MRLKTYWKKLKPLEKRTFAAACGTSYDYMKQVANGHSRPGVELAARIDRETGGKVDRKQFRPEAYK